MLVLDFAAATAAAAAAAATTTTATILRRRPPPPLLLLNRKRSKLSCDEPCRVYNTSRWWAAEFVDSIMTGKNDEVYDKKPQRYAEDNVTQWLIWSLSNNNKRLRTSYFEANYWQTQSISRPLCNNRATCSGPSADAQIDIS